MASRGLGVLTLDLVAKIGGFESGMNKAARTADKRMAEIEKRGRAMGKALGTALTAGAGIAAAGMGLYIKNTIEAEKVQAQLVSRIKDTFGAAGRSIEQLNAQASKLQGMTVFDDETIGSAQAMLLTFKEIRGVRFDEATAAVLDMSTAMGSDAVSAAVQLGKALNDPIKGVAALSKIGIQFTDDQKKVIKSLLETGDVAGAQKIILDELAGQMGTAAEAARNTLGGAFQALKNTMDNLLEGDGGSLTGLKNAVEDLNDTLGSGETKSAIDGFATGLVKIANAAIVGAREVAGFMADLKDTFSSNPSVKFQADAIKAQKALIAQREKDFSPDTPVFGTKKLREQLAKMERDYQNAIGPGIRGQLDAALAPLPRGAATDGLGLRDPRGATGKASNKTSDADRAAAEAIREQREAMRELEEQVRRVTDAKHEFGSELEDLRAEMEGPLAVAQLAHKRSLLEIEELARAGEVSTKDLADAKGFLADQHEKATEAIEKQLNPGRELLEDLEFELALMKMTNAERATAIQLRGMDAEQVAKYGEEIRKANENLEEMAEQQALLDDLKAGLSDMFVDFVSGAKSAKEAFGDFADDLFATALRFVADTAVKAFFDAMKPGGAGRTQSGGFDWGGAVGAVFSAFGGGRAGGGSVNASTLYQVNERGPELLSVSGKDYLMMGADAGRVTPNHELRGSGGAFTQIIHQNYAAPNDPRTRDQAAGKIAFETQRAMSRNR